MRLYFAIMVFAVAAAVMPCSASAASRYGRVIYALTANKQPTGPADVFERDLDTGKTKVLISRKGFPNAFEGHIVSLAISPNGRSLAIIGKSGEGDRATDSIWVWEREHNRFRGLLGEQSHRYEHWWSPSGRYLLIRDSGTRVLFESRWVFENDLWLYDAERRQLRRLEQIKDPSIAAWSTTDDAVIAAGRSGEGAIVYLLTPRTGRQQVLFKWPQAIYSITPLGGGSGYALSSGYSMNYVKTGIYLTDGRGGHPRKLAIPKVHENEATEEGGLSAGFALNGSGARLAVLAEYSHGMPALSWTKQLWCVEPRKLSSLLVGEWEGRDLFPDQMEAPPWTYTSYDLVGWLPGGRSVLMCARTRGVKQDGSPADHLALWAYDMAQQNAEGKQLFDSGPGCLGMTWWAGK